MCVWSIFSTAERSRCRSYGIRVSPCLSATRAQRANWRVAGGGYGIHWPDVDQDLTTEGLLSGAPAPGVSPARRIAPSPSGATPLAEPPLRLPHSETILSNAKLDRFRRLSTSALVDSLKPGRLGALKVRPDVPSLTAITESWSCVIEGSTWMVFPAKCCRTK